MNAQTHPQNLNIDPTLLSHWVNKAENLTPVLHENHLPVVGLVRAEPDATLALGYRMVHYASPSELEAASYTDGDSFILDFGDHCTGYLSFNLGWVGKGGDAPARLRLVFGEVPSDVAESPYPHQGWLSGAWIADEVINVDYLPQQVQITRRHAFRYVKVEVIYTSANFNVTFKNVTARAVTSAGKDTGVPAAYESELMKRIDQISIATLRDCMQTSFEDGPRRDRRLWIGDLRLQALANDVSFKNYDLVKRCLYLFAGLPRDDGYVTACVYEKPTPQAGQDTIMDYAGIYGCTLLEYCQATNDLATGHELWPVVRRQITLILEHVGEDGLFRAPENFWVFIDWRKELDKSAAMQGVIIYCLEKCADLAKVLGAPSEAEVYQKQAEKMRNTALRSFYDDSTQLFLAGPEKQISWASQVWMSLANVGSKEIRQTALKKILQTESAVMPQTPYLYHYMVEALIYADLVSEAKDLIEHYWGGMTKAGADTFWEAYDPKEPQTSPYGSKHVNSYCHAWSCTPTWFIRKHFNKP